MRISPKRLIVNLKYANLKGDVLDISSDNSGIIYSLIKSNNLEKKNINVDYFSDNNQHLYDSAAIFFTLGSLGKLESQELIKDVYKSIKEDGEIYIWDRIKAKGDIVHDNVVAKMPNGKEKYFNVMNLNPFYEFNIDKCKNLLNKYFKIEEKVIWDKVIYIKAIKRNNLNIL